MLVFGDLCTLILLEVHCTLYSKNPGMKKMHANLRQFYFWSGMRLDVADFVAQCLECQRINAEHQHLAGLL